MCRLTPSFQPRAANSSRKAPLRLLPNTSVGKDKQRKPRRRVAPCARAAMGHAAAPPSTLRNSLRFMPSPQLKRSHRIPPKRDSGRGLGYCNIRWSPMSESGHSRRLATSEPLPVSPGEGRADGASVWVCFTSNFGHYIGTAITDACANNRCPHCCEKERLTRYAKNG
jgi:hypothetical protein